jgi:dienelactone hydrolase
MKFRVARNALALTLVALTASISGCATWRLEPSSRAAADLREQVVQIPSADLTLGGVLFTPAADAVGRDRRPAVLLLHGCGGMVDSRGELAPRHRDWAERFARWGFVALALDSFRPRGLRSICELKDRPIHAWKERSADAYAALAYLAGRRDVDPARVLVLGWSHGGSTVMSIVRQHAAGRRPDGPQFMAAVAFYPGCATPLRLPSYRTTVPLLILHGEADDWTPAAPCVELATKMQAGGLPVQTVTFPGAPHGFDQPGDRIRYLPDVYNPLAQGERGATVGAHPQARAQAIEIVRKYVDHLRGPDRP